MKLQHCDHFQEARKLHINRQTCVDWLSTFWLGSAVGGGARGRKHRNLDRPDREAKRRLGCFLVKSCGGVRPNSTICTRRASRMTGSLSWDSTFSALQQQNMVVS